MRLSWRWVLLWFGILAALHLEVSARAAAPQAGGWSHGDKQVAPVAAALKQTTPAPPPAKGPAGRGVDDASDEDSASDDEDDDEDDEGQHYDEHDDGGDDDGEEDDEDDEEDDDEAYQEDQEVMKHSEADRQLQLFKSELECPEPAYEKMKEKFLDVYRKWSSQDFDVKHPETSFLLAILFVHLDKNMDSHLNAQELNKEFLHAGWVGGCQPSAMIAHGDQDGDGLLDSDEFIRCLLKAPAGHAPDNIEGVSLVTLDKELQWVRRRAKLGDNVELPCGVSGSPAPPIVWQRAGQFLGMSRPAGAARDATERPPRYPAADNEMRVFEDGTLFIPAAQMFHAGNYSCSATRNRDVVQHHTLDIYTGPVVSVEPGVQTRLPGEDAVVFCHVTGEPFPQVQWLKGEEPLRATDPRKYVTIGNGTELRVRHVDFGDTGVYYCRAHSDAGTTRDMSTIIVVQQDTQTVKLQTVEHRFFVFDDRGISIYEPHACRLQRYMSAASFLPPPARTPSTRTRSGAAGAAGAAAAPPAAMCGVEGEQFCVWGDALNVNDRYMYVTQPTYDRVLVVSIPQMAVVEVIPTDAYPVRLHWVPHTGQVWVLCWRSDQDDGFKTIQVIRDAGEKRRHETVHLQPVRDQFDVVQNLFIPPFGRDLMRGMKYGYVSHARQQSLTVVHLEKLHYVRTADLSHHNCIPADVAFSALYGFVFVRCQSPDTGRDSKLLVMDYLTDQVLKAFDGVAGRIFVTPDSRRLVVLQDGHSGVNIVVMRVQRDGLSFHFDIRSTLNLSDVAFYPSTSAHGYDAFATTVDKDDVLFLDLFTGQVEMMTGVGKPIEASKVRFSAPVRPIYSPATFDRYLVTPGYNMVFVINGHARSVGCEVGALDDPRIVAWASSMPT